MVPNQSVELAPGKTSKVKLEAYIKTTCCWNQSGGSDDASWRSKQKDELYVAPIVMTIGIPQFRYLDGSNTLVSNITKEPSQVVRGLALSTIRNTQRIRYQLPRNGNYVEDIAPDAAERFFVGIISWQLLR